MKSLFNFLKVTIKGGVFFVIPTIFVLIIAAKAVNILLAIARPIAEKLQFAHLIGPGMESVMSVVLLLIICFIGGLLMRTVLVQKMIKLLEENVLVMIPGYTYLMAFSKDQLKDDYNENWKPASVFIDDNEVICFVIDESENYCTIFLPSAPTPSSGSVCVREKKIVRYLPLSVKEAVFLIRRFGRGAAVIMEKAKPVN